MNKEDEKEITIPIKLDISESEEELKQCILKIIKEESASIAEILAPAINKEFGKIF